MGVIATARIFDAHVHFWDAGARHHAWLDGEPQLRRRFTPDDLDTGRHDCAGVLAVQADCADDEALAEVQWVSALARDCRLIRGVVAYAPLHTGQAAAPALERLAEWDMVVGVRRLLQDEPAARLLDPALAEGVQLLAHYAWPFDLCIRAHQIPSAVGLVERCPQVTFVLDHVGKPPVAAGRLDPWRDDLARLAQLPNVRCKLSGLVTELGRADWRPEDLRPYLDHALAVFGPQRCLAASDWPLVGVHGSIERWMDLLLDVIADLPPADQDAVLGGVAAQTYALNLPALDEADARRDVHR
jgi:L-fuconolactonase